MTAYLDPRLGQPPLGFTSLKVSTVMIFDLGVYLCVWGGLAGYSLGLLGLDEPVEADGVTWLLALIVFVCITAAVSTWRYRATCSAV